MKKSAILSIALLFALSAQALEFTVDNLKYTTNADSTSVTVKNPVVKPVGELVIPSHVTYNGKEYIVTSIGAFAFERCSTLSSIKLPANLTSIGEAAFRACVNLTSITLSENTTLIDACAFALCYHLDSILIPKSVKSIGDGAFLSCIALTSVTIPANVDSIGLDVFCGCSRLSEFCVADDNQNFSAVDGVLFSKDKTTLVVYPNAKAPNYVIPSHVTTIGSGAFAYCEALISVTIPEGVTSIKDGAFVYCMALSSITIPEGVTSIEKGAFSTCYYLNSIMIPSSVTSIELGAFCECYSVREIYVKNTTPPSVGAYGFYGADTIKCKLYVPIGSKAAYAAANEWKDFENIEEIDFASVPTNEETPFMISTDDDGMTITGVETGATITVYTITGTKLLTLPATGDKQRITLSSGEIYIVKVGYQTMKVAL
ncbi:MAG: leucine-rich repeat domain-containing protein [Bacteroidales bacterium]|nr:leucine-rich repeat domain-containing protein [Bacteroidales bacterium]